MKHIAKVTPRQMTICAIYYFIGTTVLVVPATLAAEAKQDAWIASIIGTGIGLLIGWFYAKLAALYPGRNLAEYLQLLMGKWLGTLISLLYIFFLLTVVASLIWVVGHFLTVQILPGTPMVALHIAFILVVVFGVKLGIEPLARTAEIFFFWFFLQLAFFALVLLPDIEFENITPIFEQGIKPILHSSLYFISVAPLTMFSFLFFLPSLNRSEATPKVMLKGMLIGGIVAIIITFLCIVVLGPDFTERNVYPTYSLARKTNLGRFLERIEVFIAGIWLITMFYNTALYFYALVVSVVETFHLRDYRPIVLPLGLTCVVYSFIVHPNSVYSDYWHTKGPWISFVFTFGFLIPFLLWVIGKWKLRRNKDRWP